MRTTRMLALGASLLLLAGCATGGGASPTPAPTIRIGSAGFYESALMAEIYAQVLEANGYTVNRQLQIGPRDTTFPALTAGDFDLMPEYIGSLLEFVSGGAGEASGDSQATYERLQQRLEEHSLTALGYTPAQDTNAFVVRRDTAEQHGLAKMSDLAAVQHDLTWGLPPECETNPLCGGALREAYGIDFDEIRLVELGACGGEIATALNGGAVDVGELCSTQPDIARFDFVVLEDDQGTQPAENLAPIVRDEWLTSTEADLAAILDPVSAQMTTDQLTELNIRVGVEQEDFAPVARDWLTEKGLLPER
ncbi:MAG TPA: ABC transporter substrate-binding protein [Candidatus Limnocylindria bacterium]|nr:ABC transporter substrate-binding protein [Candidatus Limnocylindria bacterium]